MPDATVPVAPRFVEISLKYDGKDVNDGTMPIQDVVSALQGFSGAYSKLANRYDPNEQHQIRVYAISKSSFAVLILAWATEHHQILVKGSAAAVQWIIGTIVKVIELKKATKGQPPISVTVKGDNNTVLVTTVGNVQLEVPVEAYEAFQNKTIDPDLSRITSPLEEGRIDRAMISALGPDRKQIQSTSIDSAERAYFRSDEISTTTSKPVDVQGEFVSLNKVHDRGTFRMQNGKSVPYRFKAEDPKALYAEFVYNGPVMVECVASFDPNLEVKGLEITRVTRLQPSLEFSDDEPPSIS